MITYATEALLPTGYIDPQGIQHNEVYLHSLTGREEELLADCQGQATPAMVTTLISRCVQRIGDIQPISARLVRALSDEDRYYLLIKLRQATFGDQVYASLTCPWQDCGKRVGLHFPLSDLPPSPSDATIETTCYECGRPFVVPFDIAAFFFGEFKGSRDRLYREVHFLAYHYHWGEREIMEMPSLKRRAFIDLLSDALDPINDAPSPFLRAPQAAFVSNLDRLQTDPWVEVEDPTPLAESLTQGQGGTSRDTDGYPDTRSTHQTTSGWAKTNEAAGTLAGFPNPASNRPNAADSAFAGSIGKEPTAHTAANELQQTQKAEQLRPISTIEIPSVTAHPPSAPALLAAVLNWVAESEDDSPDLQESQQGQAMYRVSSKAHPSGLPNSKQASTLVAFDNPVYSVLKPVKQQKLSAGTGAVQRMEAHVSQGHPSSNRLEQSLPVAASIEADQGEMGAPLRNVETKSASERRATLGDIEQRQAEDLQPMLRQRPVRSSAVTFEETTVPILSSAQSQPSQSSATQPPVIERIVVVRQPSAAATPTHAFWERSHLHQFQLRLLR